MTFSDVFFPSPFWRPLVSSKTKGLGEQGAAGILPRNPSHKKGPRWCSALSIGVIGKSALEIGQFLRRNFWMISGGPFLSRPLWFTADLLTFTDFPGERRHININFLLWLTSEWPWDKRLVVPGLTGPKSLCVRLETQEI